ncbi:MAG: glutaredoxin 3 [Bdellovibrionales bacterium]
MPSVQIYTWSNCPYCVRAKDLLTRKGVKFSEINLDGQDEELKELRNRTGLRTVPQIFINDRFVGGYTDLADLDSKGELDRMLSASP